MKRYRTVQEFIALNNSRLEEVKRASSDLRGTDQIGVSGMPLAEAERLSYRFLYLMNICTDLLFGVSASVGNAKANRNKIEALQFRSSDGKVKDREHAALSSEEFIEAARNYNDLNDLYDYLKMKHDDFEKNHWYYKHIGNNNG